MYVTIVTQGSKKGLYDHPGQVDFLAGQVTLHSHALHKQGPRCVIYQLNHSKTKCPGQEKFESCWSERQAGIQFFLS